MDIEQLSLDIVAAIQNSRCTLFHCETDELHTIKLHEANLQQLIEDMIQDELQYEEEGLALHNTHAVTEADGVMVAQQTPNL